MNIKKLINNKLISGGGLFLLALIISDAMNFLFSAFITRFLTFEELGLVTFINTLWNFVNIFVASLGLTVTHEIAYMSARQGNDEGIAFYKSSFKKTFYIAMGVMFLWMMASPFLSEFFDIDRIFPFLIFAPMITLGMLTANNKGFLQGRLFFGYLALFTVIEAASKLVIGVVFWMLHLQSWIYTAVILSEVIDFLCGMWLVGVMTKGSHGKHLHSFPNRFFNAAVMSKLSTTSFIMLDVIFAKHFLSPTMAGQYAFLSFMGKMVFYFGSMLNTFVVSLVSRDEGLKKDPTKTFNTILMTTALLTFSVYLFIGPLGYWTIPFLFGKKAYDIVNFLPIYGLAIALFTITNQIVTFRLSRRHYLYSALALGYSLFVILGMFLFHQDIGQIVQIVFGISILSFVTLFVMNLLDIRGEWVRRNAIDLLQVFLPIGTPSVNLNKKRILVFNWRDTRHTFAGGAEVYIHEIAKRWVKMGYHVTVFCGNDGKSARHEILDGVEILRRGGFYFVYIWAFVYYMIRLRGKFDVVIDSENGIPFFTPLYVREPVYCLMHHVHQEVFRRSLIKPLALLATFLEETAMPFVYRKVQFITVSDSTKKEMFNIGLGKKGIAIIHPGVDITTLSPAAKNKKPMVLYLGRLKAYKTIDVFIRSIPALIKQFPTAEFVIAGDGEEKNKLTKLAKKLRIDDKVKFLGKITEEEKIALYQRAWIFVNPSMMEGWGITTIEANACGTPVVASNVPGLRDSIKNPHTGFLVEYGNVEAFTEKISQLLTDKKLLHRMSKEATNWAKTFDWDKSAKMSLDLVIKEK